MNNIYYIILNVTELSAINFAEILQTSPETVRKSNDNTKTFVKWFGENIPLSIQALQTKEGPYTHSEILEILNTKEWTANNSLINS